MNIFRILSSNDGTINEPNVSSFLAYILNPQEDHGLSSLLLQELLGEIILLDEAFLSKIKFENRIADLSKYSGYSINVVPEMSVIIPNGNTTKRRDIDILLEIKDSKSEEILYSICLENKITDASIIKKDSQLEDELKGLKNYYSENNLNPEIYVVYLTPSPSDISKQSFEKLNYNKKCHLYWDNSKNSIFSKLTKIFKEERDGIVDPINDQSVYLIKSFLSFIKTNFKSYIEEREEKREKKNYGKPVIDHLKDLSLKLNPSTPYKINDLKNMFSEHVLKTCDTELHKTTRDMHIKMSIVNEKNRGHYSVKKPDDERKNIFYYIDNSCKTVKIFDARSCNDIEIFYKNGDEIVSELSQEILE
jgi:hypothetical protein